MDGANVVVVGKVFKLLPLVFDLVGKVQDEIKAAKDAASVGGAKVTATEVGKIVATHAPELLTAIVAIFVDE